MGVDGIAADAQDLGIPGLELLGVALEVGEFGLSAAGEVQHIEGEEHRLAPELGEGIGLPVPAWEAEIGGWVTYTG